MAFPHPQCQHMGAEKEYITEHQIDGGVLRCHVNPHLLIVID